MAPEEQINEQEFGAEDADLAGSYQEAPQMEPLVIKPKNNIYTLLLIISILLTMVAIYLVGWELRNYYEATFGILSPKENQTATEHVSQEKPADSGTETPSEE